MALLAMAAPALAATSVEPSAWADEAPEVEVGTALEATADVTLHKATIAKGSRVNVTKLLLRSGRLEGVSAALADGHVVKISMAQLHTSFRVAKD
jgi:hypothetical protein